MIDVRTERQKRTDAARGKIMALYREIEHLEGSRWSKCEAIAKRMKCTPHNVNKVIKMYNGTAGSTPGGNSAHNEF